MCESLPHFLLLSEARNGPCGLEDAGELRQGGRWHFLLEPAEGGDVLEVSDVEPEPDPQRLELLAVIRALESLDQPSRVTLVTNSRYVNHGLRYGLAEWRENEWQWECFGEMAPVRDADLWRRLDRALRYHQVECRLLRFDASHEVRSRMPTGEGGPALRPHVVFGPGKEPHRASS